MHYLQDSIFSSDDQDIQPALLVKKRIMKADTELDSKCYLEYDSIFEFLNIQ